MHDRVAGAGSYERQLNHVESGSACVLAFEVDDVTGLVGRDRARERDALARLNRGRRGLSGETVFAPLLENAGEAGFEGDSRAHRIRRPSELTGIPPVEGAVG